MIVLRKAKNTETAYRMNRTAGKSGENIRQETLCGISDAEKIRKQKESPLVSEEGYRLKVATLFTD